MVFARYRCSQNTSDAGPSTPLYSPHLHLTRWMNIITIPANFYALHI